MKTSKSNSLDLLRRNAYKITPVNAFCVASITGLIILIACFVATRGELLTHYFYVDQRDTGMDFFHSLEYVRGRHPYKLFDTLYPPLANLFFLCLYYIIPTSVSSNWASDFWESISYRGTYWDLRTFQGPMLMFILVLVVSAWMLVTLINCILKKMPYRQANTVALCILLSPGMMMAFERGNILFFVIPLCLFYVCYRNSESRFMRELALIALALAAGFKLYPAFFGVLLIKDKKYKEAIRAVIYGILTVVLPVFVFKEGLSGIPLWLSAVFEFGSGSDMPHIGTGFVNILHRIVLYFDYYLGIELPARGFSYAAMLLSVMLLAASLFLKKNWQSTLAITLAIIMFGSNGQYIYAFVCVPVVLILLEEEKFTKENIIPCVLTMLLCINLPLFYTHRLKYPDVAFKQFISVLIVCWCLFYGVRNFKVWYKNQSFRRKSHGNLEK